MFDYLVAHGRMKEKEARSKFRQVSEEKSIITVLTPRNHYQYPLFDFDGFDKTNEAVMICFFENEKKKNPLQINRPLIILKYLVHNSSHFTLDRLCCTISSSKAYRASRFKSMNVRLIDSIECLLFI